MRKSTLIAALESIPGDPECFSVSGDEGHEPIVIVELMVPKTENYFVPEHDVRKRIRSREWINVGAY